jgi:hypothetical protein
VSTIDTEPVEAAHTAKPHRSKVSLGIKPRRDCEICGKPIAVNNMAVHLRRAHNITPDGKPQPPKPAPKAGKPSSLKAELEVTYGLMAEFWAMRDPYCGNVARGQVPEIAKAWDAWAQSSPPVHRVLSALMAQSGPMMVFAAHMPILFAVRAHHSPEARAARQGEAEQQAAEAVYAEQMAGATNGQGYVPQADQIPSEYAGTVFEPGSADRAR